MAGDSYRRIEAVRKTADIIKHLGTAKGKPQTSAEIAEAVGLPEGTTLCHLVTLADAGFVRAIGDGWQVGMGLALVYHRVVTNLEGERDRIGSDLQKLGRN